MKEYVDRQGNSHYDVITIAPILDENGDIVQILETSRDVTGRIRTMTGWFCPFKALLFLFLINARLIKSQKFDMFDALISDLPVLLMYTPY